MKQTDFAKALTDFLTKYLAGQRNLSTNTIKSYRDTFKQLLVYLKEEAGISPEYLTFNDLNKEKIEDFLYWLEKNKNVSINTRNQRLAAIHSFFRYVQSENPEILFECQRILGISFKKREIKPINFISEECLEYIFQQPDLNTFRGRRDLTMLVTLYDSGARIQELIDLKVRNIRLTDPATILLSGKRRKQRYVPIMGKSKKLLEGYMKEARLLTNGKEDHPLFFNSSHRPFTRPGITYILEKYLKSAKDKNPKILFPDKL
ncbi:MAG: tyrosine-type recombinase/integrase, partial [bacterium]